jgi:hypothetical protein
MADNDYDLKIGADSSAASAEFNKLSTDAEKAALKIQTVMREASYKMASAVKESTEKMHSEFEKVTGTLEKMKGAMIAFAAVAAGGAAFKQAVDASVEMTKSANALGKSLGITATEASILNVALDDVYLSSDTINTANAKLTKTLGSNEAAFTNLGVSTRDANGHFRSSLDIMLDTNTHLLKFKEGIDRNIEGQKIYGKSWAEVSGILKLTAAGMEESKAKAEQLGLVVGQENVEATAKYRAAMNDVHDVLQATEKAIGDALLPVLTQLGEWFSSAGPGLVLIFKGAIGGLTAAFHVLIFTVKMVTDILFASFKTIVDGAMVVGDVVNKVFHGDFAGAYNAAKEGAHALVNNVKDGFREIQSDAEETNKKIGDLFSAPTATGAKGEGAQSDGKDPKEKKAKAATSRVSDWKEELTVMLDESQNYFKDSLADELKFWTSKLALAKNNKKERQAVEHEIFALHKKQAQEELQNEIADLKAQSEAYAAGGVDRIRIAGEIATKIGDKYGIESKEYKTALLDMAKAAQEHQKQLDKLEELHLERIKDHAIAELEIKRDSIKQQLTLGEITTTQSLVALQKLAEEEYQIELKSAQDKAELIVGDVVAKQQAYDKIEALAEKHRLEMKKISGQMAVEQKTMWDKNFAPISSAFEKTVGGIIQGTTTLQKGLANMFKSIALEFANMGVKMVVQWISNEARKTMATVSGVAARTTAETTGAAASTSVGGMAAIKNIMNSAYESMAGAYKAIVGIPFVGPYLAPVVAAGAFAAVAGIAGSVASAEGGYDIPSGVNPMTQLHEKEMVLPKAEAEKIRNLDNGGIGGSGITHIHTSGGDFIHKKDLAKLLKQMNRNFVVVK